MKKEIFKKLKAHKVEIFSRENLSFIEDMGVFAQNVDLKINKSIKDKGYLFLVLESGFLKMRVKFKEKDLDQVMSSALVQFLLYKGISGTVVTKIKSYKI